MTSPTTAARPKPRALRLGLLLLALLLLFFVAKQSAWLSSIDPSSVRATVQQWGELGIVIYALAFTAGLLLYVPGTLFIVVAGLMYGPIWGSLIAIVVANFAVFVSFNLIRFLGGKSSANDIHPWVSAQLKAIGRKPIRTIAYLRTFLWTAPFLNYLLALTSIEQRHHFVGTLLGTAVPIITIVLASDWLLMRWNLGG